MLAGTTRHSFRQVRPNLHQRQAGRMRVVDLFAGAGLLSHAFHRHGFQVTCAVEMDRWAARTYRRSVGDHVICADVRSLVPRGRCEVLVGGPPCQGFSTLGKRHPLDPRNLLALEFVRWAKVLKPKIVLVENVEPFLRAPVWATLARSLEQLGYAIDTQCLNALNYGAAQRRRRSFTIASKVGDLEVHPLPEFNARTVREAWEGLAPMPNGRNGHYAPFPSDIALRRMRNIPPGGGKRELMQAAPELCPPSWWRTPREVVDVWGRLRWDEPSNTVRTCCNNASKGRYIHPNQNRVMSLREAARLQSIPDEFEFDGQPIHVARQIGNAIPPALGCAMASAVKRALSG